MAEVHVLGIEKETLVEQPGRFGVGPMDEQAGAADPVGILPLPRQRVDGPAARQPLLAQLVQRADHAAERELGVPGAVHQPRSDDSHVRITLELGQQ